MRYLLSALRIFSNALRYVLSAVSGDARAEHLAVDKLRPFDGHPFKVVDRNLQREKISFKVCELRDFFPRHYTAAQMMQEIKVALKERQQRLARQRDHSR